MDISEEIPISEGPICTRQDRPPAKNVTETASSNRRHSQPEVVSPRPAVETEFKPQAKVGQYFIIEQIGSGGFGDVYKARDDVHDRVVAIKVLRTDDPIIRKRFEREAKVISRLNHPNIITIYTFNKESNPPYLVLEFLRGKQLTNLLSEADGNPLPLPQIFKILKAVASALAKIHAEGIAHRDLTASNVVIVGNEQVKLIDFGICKISGERALTVHPDRFPTLEPLKPEDYTAKDSALGTLRYMSPEQCLSQGIDSATDIWAFGIVAFLMLAGRHPYPGLAGEPLYYLITSNYPMPGLRNFAPKAPQRLIELVDRCLQKNKHDRPSAATIIGELELLQIPTSLKADENPYVGLSPFQETSIHKFFGREQEAAMVVNRISNQPVSILTGPSGNGKSSLARTLVSQTLQAEGWDVAITRPGRDPLAALASLVLSVDSSSFSISSTISEEIGEENRLTETLKIDPTHAGKVFRKSVHRGERHFLLMVDQAEEAFTIAQDEDRRLFFQNLFSLVQDAKDKVRLCLICRSDYIHRLSEHMPPEHSSGVIILRPLSPQGLMDAIVKPAQMAGYEFENKVIDALIKGVRASHQPLLGLLQFVLSYLWEHRDVSQKIITAQAYNELGRLEGALARHADAVLNQLSLEQREIMRSLLLRLATPERTCAIVPLSELQEISPQVDFLVEKLIKAQLIVVEAKDSSVTVELIHESLINVWPTFRRYLDESSEDVAFLADLRIAAQQWDKKNRDQRLLREDLVEDARQFQKRFKGELPAVEREFMQAIIAQSETAAREKEAAALATARKKRLVVRGTISFLVILLAAALVAVFQIRSAKQEAEEQAQTAKIAMREAVFAKARALVSAEKAIKKEQERALAVKKLAEKNEQLLNAIKKVKVAQNKAQRNFGKARRAQEEAIRAQKEAINYAEKLAIALQQEQERVKTLEDKIGFGIDTNILQW